MTELSKRKPREKIPIGFYKNGVLLKGFPFFPYGGSDAQNVILDILDGFSPSILRHQHPSGVTLGLVDQSKEMYTGSASKETIMTVEGIDKAGLNPKSKEQFINQFSQKIITANGNILNLRDEVSKRLNGKELYSNQEGTTEPFCKTNAAGERILYSELFLPSMDLETSLQEIQSDEKVSTLKLRSDQGVFVLHIHGHKTIKELYEQLHKSLSMALGLKKLKEIEISSSVLRKTYGKSEKATLKEEGLYPNSALILKITKE